MRKVRNLRILKILSTFSKKEPTFDVGVINEEIPKRDNLSRFHFSRGDNFSPTSKKFSVGYNLSPTHFFLMTIKKGEVVPHPEF